MTVHTEESLHQSMWLRVVLSLTFCNRKSGTIHFLTRENGGITFSNNMQLEGSYICPWKAALPMEPETSSNLKPPNPVLMDYLDPWSIQNYMVIMDSFLYLPLRSRLKVESSFSFFLQTQNIPA